MTIRIDGEATCSNCRATARCTVDVDLLMSRSKASPGGLMHGLPDWYWMDGDQGLFCTYNLACSEKCMKVLAKDTRYSGVVWKRCNVETPNR